MKKTIILFALLCINIMVWGQTEDGKEKLRKAQAGDAEAQYWVSWYYEDGKKGFPKDDQESIKWLKKSAENGYAEAQFWFGYYYKCGKYGLPKDENEALKWYLKSADGGYDFASFSLGLYYKDINKQEAIYWFKKGMDDRYDNYGEEDEIAADELRKLGVVYHPRTRSTTYISSSSSGSSSSLVSSTDYAEISSTFFSTNRTYDVERYTLFYSWPAEVHTYKKGESTFLIANKQITLKYGDGSKSIMNITSSPKNISVGTVSLPVVEINDNRALRAIRWKDGHISVYIYVYNGNTGKYLLLSEVALFK